MTVKISVVTAFPDLIRTYLSTSVLGRGIEAGKLAVSVVDLRDFSEGGYRQIDDYSFGGGGMVLMAKPLEAALDSISGKESRYVVYPSPQGVPLYQELVEDLSRISATRHLVIVCGHYEGVDERFAARNVDCEISVGDFVLTGGELPALAIVDAVSRLVDGVVGRKQAVEDDSFFSGMLDHPHYTRPACYDGDSVPEVLLGGNQAAIDSWRKREAVARTLSRRPDIVARAGIGPYLECGVYAAQLHYPVLDRKGNVSTTAITGMDLHDIARACRTYGIGKYLIVMPLQAQREMIKKIASHWTEGYGAQFNPDRRDAMQRIKTVSSLQRAIDWIREKEKRVPFTIATTARQRDDAAHWLPLKTKLLSLGRPVLFLFGTGHGLHESVLAEADAVLAPIEGGDGDYNHLSVRTAAGIVMDRFFGFR